MDEQLLNEETQSELSQKVRRRKKTRKPRFGLPIKLPAQLPGFLGRIGEDVKWYYDVRLWSPLILLLLLLAFLPGKQKEEVVAPTEPETVTIQVPPETEPAPEPIDPDAEALARLADSVGSGRSENVKTIIMWIAINRMEDRANGYGLSLIEEIERPNQWQGYEPSVSYSDETYALAKEVLEIREKGKLRPLDSDMLWLVLNDNGSVTVRNQFTAGNNQKWHEKTVN